MLNAPPPPQQNIASPTPNTAVPRESPVFRGRSPRGNNSLGLGGLVPPAQDPIKHRGISPMGERMLKVCPSSFAMCQILTLLQGQFDGFGM